MRFWLALTRVPPTPRFVLCSRQERGAFGSKLLTALPSFLLRLGRAGLCAVFAYYLALARRNILLKTEVVPTTLVGIKRFAKVISRRDDIPYIDALDRSAQTAGFLNYQNAWVVLGDGDSLSSLNEPTITIIGNHDGYRLFKETLLNQIAKPWGGSWALAVGDRQLCHDLAGIPYTSVWGIEAVIDDATSYLEAIRHVGEKSPRVLGFQSPPDDPAVFSSIVETLKACGSEYAATMAVALPSYSKEELIEKSVRLLKGIDLSWWSVHVILDQTISADFREAA
jgi:hypothetical protein